MQNLITKIGITSITAATKSNTLLSRPFVLSFRNFSTAPIKDSKDSANSGKSYSEPKDRKLLFAKQHTGLVIISNITCSCVSFIGGDWFVPIALIGGGSSYMYHRAKATALKPYKKVADNVYVIDPELDTIEKKILREQHKQFAAASFGVMTSPITTTIVFFGGAAAFFSVVFPYYN